MSCPSLRFRRFALLALGTISWLLPAPALWAQANDNILPAIGTDAIKAEYRTYRSFLPELFKGQISIRNDEQKERYNKAIDCEARWIMYRFTWRTDFHIDPGMIDRLFKEFEHDLNGLVSNKDTQYVLDRFAKQLVIYGKEVLQTNQPIARLNAARVLEKTATAGAAQNELADLFIEILNDPNQTNEGVKFYALRGVRNLLALPRPKQPILTRDREEKAIQTVLEFVDHKVEYTPAAPRDEVEGYRSMRREGFRALAWSRYPSLTDKGRPGLVLLRAAVRDGFVPDLRFDEQFEAAEGVCRLQPQLDPSYQKDYAIYILGSFIVDLGSQYQRDKDKKDKRPYRYYAARLLDALELMKADTKNKPVDTYTRNAVAECVKVLSRIEQDGTPVPLDLSVWLEKNPPPSKQLYSDGPDSTVKPAAPREAAETPAAG